MSDVFSTGVLIGDTVYSRSNWNLEVLVFMEGGKPDNPEKNPLSKDENQQQTQPTYDTGPESNPGHIVRLKACKYRNASYILCLLCVTDFSKFCSKM